MKNIGERCVKSAVEGFAAVFVPALCAFLQDGNMLDAHAWALWVAPVAGAAIAAAISAAWNTYENRQSNGDH